MKDHMATSATSAPAPVELNLQRPQRSLWGDAWRRLIASTNGRLGLAICLALIALAIVVPLAQPYDARGDRNLRARLLPPSWMMTPAEREQKKVTTWAHPFGTDELGRDLFVRVLHGAPISLTVGLFAVLMSVIFGSLLGLVAGYRGGWFDTAAVWLMDIVLAFPSTLLAIAIISASNSPTSLSTRLGNAAASVPILGDIVDPQLFNAMLAVAIVEIPVFGRITRATVFAIRHQEYITAATALGIGGRRKLFRHILPNSLAPMLVQATLSIATAIISVAALGFLGLGARPPRPEWGTMLSTARD
jgi:peptide/nickel transport system permease protein